MRSDFTEFFKKFQQLSKPKDFSFFPFPSNFFPSLFWNYFLLIWHLLVFLHFSSFPHLLFFLVYYKFRVFRVFLVLLPAVRVLNELSILFSIFAFLFSPWTFHLFFILRVLSNLFFAFCNGLCFCQKWPFHRVKGKKTTKFSNFILRIHLIFSPLIRTFETLNYVAKIRSVCVLE